MATAVAVIGAASLGAGCANDATSGNGVALDDGAGLDDLSTDAASADEGPNPDADAADAGDSGQAGTGPLSFQVHTLFDHAGAWAQCLEDGSIWYPYGDSFVHSRSPDPSIVGEIHVPLGRYDPVTQETEVTLWEGCTHKGGAVPGTVLFDALAWQPTVVARWSCLDPDYGDYPLGWLDPDARTVRGPLAEGAMHFWPPGPTAWGWRGYICGQAPDGLSCTNREAPLDSQLYEFSVSPYWDLAGDRLVAFLLGDVYLAEDPAKNILRLPNLDQRHFTYAVEQDAFYVWREDAVRRFHPPDDWVALPPVSGPSAGFPRGFIPTPDGRLLIEFFGSQPAQEAQEPETVMVREVATGTRRVVAEAAEDIWPTWPRFSDAAPPRPAWVPWLLVTEVSDDGGCSQMTSIRDLDSGAVIPVGRTSANVKKFHVLSPGLGIGNYFGGGAFWYLYPPTIGADGSCEPQDEQYELVRADLETGEVNTVLSDTDVGGTKRREVVAFDPQGRFFLVYEREYEDPSSPYSVVPYGGTVVAWDITDPTSPRRIVLAHNAYSHIEPCGACYLISTLPNREEDTALTVVEACPK